MPHQYMNAFECRSSARRSVYYNRIELPEQKNSPSLSIKSVNSNDSGPTEIGQRKNPTTLAEFRRQKSAPHLLRSSLTSRSSKISIATMDSINKIAPTTINFSTSFIPIHKASAPIIFFKLFNPFDMFNVFFSMAKENISAPATSLSSNSNREQLIAAVYKQLRAKQRMLEPYVKLRTALQKMRDEYLESKEQNVFRRCNHMQHMIHEVVLLEKQYWQLIDIPQQEISETPNAYVLRIVNLLDEKGTQPVKPGTIASLLGTTLAAAERTKDQTLYDSLRGKTTEELKIEGERLYTELYKLIHKYHALRTTVQQLSESYQDTRFYPGLARYPLLKTMIKRVLRAPAFADICRETTFE